MEEFEKCTVDQTMSKCVDVSKWKVCQTISTHNIQQYKYLAIHMKEKNHWYKKTVYSNNINVST